MRRIRSQRKKACERAAETAWRLVSCWWFPDSFGVRSVRAVVAPASAAALSLRDQSLPPVRVDGEVRPEHSRKRSAASATAHRLALGTWGLSVGGEKWREQVSPGPRPLLALRQAGQLAGDTSNGALRFVANRVPSKRRPDYRSGVFLVGAANYAERHRLLCERRGRRLDEGYSCSGLAGDCLIRLL